MTHSKPTDAVEGILLVDRVWRRVYIRQTDIVHDVCYHMPCRIRCNECELDKLLEDCVTAHKQAKEHEARYADHWITLYDPPDSAPDRE